MTNGGKRVPIHIKVENIENPEDISEYKSIHAAMKKYKKSFQTIKNYITNNNPINGYMWTKINPDGIETQSDINSDINSDIHSDVPLEDLVEYTCEVDNDYLQDEADLDESGTPREYLILPLKPIPEESNKSVKIQPPLPPQPKQPKPREQCICSIM
jgi:hypothetical protein